MVGIGYCSLDLALAEAVKESANPRVSVAFPSLSVWIVKAIRSVTTLRRDRR